jgi:hypothetical protein
VFVGDVGPRLIKCDYAESTGMKWRRRGFEPLTSAVRAFARVDGLAASKG